MEYKRKREDYGYTHSGYTLDPFLQQLKRHILPM